MGSEEGRSQSIVIKEKSTSSLYDWCQLMYRHNNIRGKRQRKTQLWQYCTTANAIVRDKIHTYKARRGADIKII